MHCAVRTNGAIGLAHVDHEDCVQGAFTITACGYDCTLRALPIEPRTPEMTAKMELEVKVREDHVKAIVWTPAPSTPPSVSPAQPQRP